MVEATTCRVLRVELPHGGGPYNPNCGDDPTGPRVVVRSEAWVQVDDGHSRHHPVPEMDVPEWREVSRGVRDQYRFGFADLASLEQWFGHVADDLEAGGYRIVEWEVAVEDVLEGGSQVAFRRDRARRMGEIPWDVTRKASAARVTWGGAL